MNYYIINKLRRYPLSLTCIAVIWYLCLGTMPKTPLDDVSFIDKWVHVSMYCGTCLVIWTEYAVRHRRINWRRIAIGAWLAPIMMSGVIELIQAYCTGGRRSGDWLDFAANTTGTTLAALIGLIVIRCIKRRGEKSDRQ